MQADAAPGQVDEHLRRFAEYAAGEGGQALTYDDFVRCENRAELGISSLDMLVLVAGYIDATAAGRVVLQPEWVPMLDDVTGIRAVVAEIDAAAGAP